MAFCLNRVQLLGHVGKDPKIAQVASGGACATFSLATSESWKDKHNGERVERTEWHDIVVWAPHLVTMVQNNVRKGTRLMVEGQLHTREWTGRDEVKRYRVEIEVKGFGGQIWLLDGLAERTQRGRKRTEEAEEGDPGSFASTPGSAGFGDANSFGGTNSFPETTTFSSDKSAFDDPIPF